VKRERGFTLIELMLVVAIIAVLAAIAVPLFTSEANSTKGESEATAICTALGLAEKAYFLENTTYLSTGTAETDTWPTAPSQAPQDLNPLPATWTALKISLPVTQTRCSYVVVAGNAGDAAGTIATTLFNFTPPTTLPWFYVLGHCDLDNDPTVDGYFFTSSVDTTLKESNPDR
jgi:prepilin-type N-terminal cleavage/methylation domain-containing protein